MAVDSFRVTTLVPVGLRADGAGFVMGGRFKVEASFSPSAQAPKYEYRQFLKGGAFVQFGRFTSSPPSRANWTHTAPRHDAKNDFGIPGGLSPNFREDGQVINGRTYRFGYRIALPVNQTGLVDHYLPNQPNGDRYEAIDTYGLRGSQRTTGLKVYMWLQFQGRIIDTSRGGAAVRDLYWKIEHEDIIT